jgi:hypothetical protein
VKTPSESVDKIFTDHIVPIYGKMDCHAWRLQYLWNEPCDIILKKYLSLIQALFKKFSGRYTMPGKPK